MSTGPITCGYMAHLRQKLEADPAQPQHLITELQVGYRLVGL